MMHTLTVYISADCWTCEETHRILNDVTPRFPDLLLRCIDAQQEPLPDGVFAVPTYLLDDRVISLGNPTREALQTRLAAVFNI
jgi:hypothetical protein